MTNQEKSGSPDTIAVFDFDNTLTVKNTSIDFGFYHFSSSRILKGMIKKFPELFGFLIGTLSSTKYKEAFFSEFCRDLSAEGFGEMCQDYQERLKDLIDEEMLEKVKSHKKKGHELVIVSASIEDWIAPWAEAHDFDEVVATRPEKKNGSLTGKFDTPNCQGEEKKKRFLEKYPNRDDYYLYMYGNSRGDKNLMSIADEKIWV